MNPMQLMMDGLSAQRQRERAATQMTLGGLIDALEALPADTKIALGEPDSYRGYYADLAFRPAETPVTAAEALAACRGAMGQVFMGYKGGKFTMGARTPVWLADYGSCGVKIMAVRPDGTLETAADD